MNETVKIQNGWILWENSGVESAVRIVHIVEIWTVGSELRFTTVITDSSPEVDAYYSVQCRNKDVAKAMMRRAIAQ